MRKVLSIVCGLGLIIGSGCTKNISDFNNRTKEPSEVPPGGLFTNAVRTLSDGLASPSVNINVFRFTVKHWGMAIYQDEANYDFTTRAIPDAWWARMYRDVLIDLQQSGVLIEASNISDGEKANKKAILDIMEVYTYSILVNTFGNVPYSEALGESNFPKYDDGATIYKDLLNRLASDVSALNSSSNGFSTTEDLVFGGQIDKWIKFGNSLQIKLALTIADADDALAKSTVESVVNKPIISSTDDDAKFTYTTSSPNVSPVYTDIVLGSRADYVAAKDLLDVLISYSDPRKTLYFKPNNAGEYVGDVVGQSITIADAAKPSDKAADAVGPTYFMDYVELEFYLAEAKERGYNVPGTAADYYTKAIKTSITNWGGTEAAANAYVAKSNVAYATATGSNWRQRIGFQKWIALYNRPYDAWTELRRFDYPVLSLPFAAISGFPNRLTYPAKEQQTNNTNYTEGASAIGGDKVETKIFWDKF